MFSCNFVFRAIEMYTKRIKWLLQGSRRVCIVSIDSIRSVGVLNYKFNLLLFLQVFGLWKGSNVAVVLDCSDANLGFGRQGSFSEILLVCYHDLLRAMYFLES